MTDEARPDTGGPGGDTGRAPLLVVTGVSGSGKTTVGERLAEALGLPYGDADDFHPAANIEKMRSGVPLDDADRAPWLDAVARWLTAHADGGAVASCSALKRAYRDRLRRASPAVFFLHLHGDFDLLAGRLAGRRGHFMPASLLRSQFDTLQPLQGDEPGVTVPVTGTVDETVARALRAVPAPRG